jgi:hypothetical protein
MTEEERIILLFNRIGLIVAASDCRDYKVDGMKYARCKLTLEFDDSIEVYKFRHDSEKEYYLRDHSVYNETVD